jgi:hypothetical protein
MQLALVYRSTPQDREHGGPALHPLLLLNYDCQSGGVTDQVQEAPQTGSLSDIIGEQGVRFLARWRLSVSGVFNFRIRSLSALKSACLGYHRFETSVYGCQRRTVFLGARLAAPKLP